MPRLVTYNVHRWLGTDRKTSPARIAEVIAACRPDVVALQEVRIAHPRRAPDSLAAVAAELGMQVFFRPTVKIGDQFGIAILTPHPVRLVRAARLPGWPGGPPLEPRAAQWIAVEVDGGELQVINTHLGLLPPERMAQAEALLGPDWLGSPDCGDRAVLLGDFNASPRSGCYRRLASRLRDAQLAGAEAAPQPTFHSRFLFSRIDHIFVTPGIEVVETQAVRTPLTRVASDHLPLVAEIRLRGAEIGAETQSAASVSG